MASRTITIGHSPDPDDAFMFYALAAGKLDTGDLQYEHILQDIETLNQRARRGELDLTAISLHAYAYVHDKYALYPCGASIGDGYGPMIVARERMALDALKSQKLAVPGEMTTAFLALRLCLGDFEYEIVPFDEIIPAVVEGRFMAGLIIHEGQLTYSQAGLYEVVDLGVWWKQETGLPLPLGANAIRKDLGLELMQRIGRDLLASIRYGLEHRKPAIEHSMAYARDMTEELADKFVGMYVNDYTIDFGPDGRKGIEELLNRGFEAGLIPERPEVEFIDF